ncbi:unnamed protein product [Rotaria magnacalcarata]|uniref:Uncharacterized protein n=3 Tax=Rotaria magnacalcarata TaxID=392030 RepID=A0A816MS32_9BILA|nr:unnamed protein product [Rotaria magnacalcarata]CAF2041649.1 unnamed protein product [Rotaria magnacalcarata]CAF2102625.1 unnamed protein product [Rotaria magnacalcarata]CAF4350457.1 unnamed protein product [Rotaria magnacalcarata]CAF5004734.1 unnamed protein product [Rotaria magnacalcarata]
MGRQGILYAPVLCLKFVNDHLYALQHQLKQYQQELNNKANNFQGYTISIQEKLMTYIERNLNSSLSKKIEHQVELIHYDYHIRALELEYFRHKPNQYQKKLMAEICQSKYEQEISEQEYEFLKNKLLIIIHQINHWHIMNVNNMDRQDNVLISIQEALKKKKCHGNRRNQRFRRKCRAQKMKPAKIKKLIEKRNRFQNKNQKSMTNIESTKLNKELLS